MKVASALLFFTAITISSTSHAENLTRIIIGNSWSMHIIHLTMVSMLLIILFRKSIGHQNRLNWFFGAISVIFIASNLQVFQRFFATPGSVMHYFYMMAVLGIYFIFYWIKTWKGEK